MITVRRSLPLGPREVRVMVESCLQASMFFSTASSRPERCRCPSFSIPCIPYGWIENPTIFSLVARREVSNSFRKRGKEEGNQRKSPRSVQPRGLSLTFCFAFSKPQNSEQSCNSSCGPPTLPQLWHSYPQSFIYDIRVLNLLRGIIK